MKRKIKLSLFLLTSLVCYNLFGCWYSKSTYIDYIYSINDKITIQTNISDNVLGCMVSNNMIVDLPLTVSMKLISDEVIDIGGSSSVVGNIMGKLQYRILPKGNWITVSEYQVESGKISKDSKPYTYFGQYNIWPKNIKAGDVIMIRLYVTDGMWQSGDLSNKCEDQLGNVSTQSGIKRTLPNVFQYNIQNDGSIPNLGGNWAPHFVSTVIYSGKERPLK